MTERPEVEHRLLLRETRRLVREVEIETGRPLVIRPDEEVRSRGRAIYVVSDPNPSQHLVLFDPAEHRFLDHLVAHELGHILRFARAQPEDRLVPLLTGRRQAEALQQLLPDIRKLIERGIPENQIADVYSIWITGTVAQLSDTPADMRIEETIWRDVPQLRPQQEASIRRQIQALHKVAGPEVEALTPRSVWIASNAMNYSLVKAVAELLRDDGLLQPFRNAEVTTLGEELFEMVRSSPDIGLAGDRHLSHLWSSRMGVGEWFELRRLDELPAGHRHAWE